jgi:hypothetical protein
MSTPKQEFSLQRPYTLWKIASIAVVAGMTLVTLISFYFIYKLVFSTIDLESEVAGRLAEPHITSFDTNALTKAESALSIKATTSTIDPKNVRAIFVYVSTTPIQYGTSTQKTSF